MASQDRIELTAEMKRRLKPDCLIQAYPLKSSKMYFSAYDLGERQNENTLEEKRLIIWESRLKHRTETDGPFFHPKSLILGVDDDDDNDGDEDEDDEDKQEDDDGDGALFEDVHIDGNSAGPTRRQRKKVQKKRRQSRRQRTKTCFFKPPPQQTKEKNVEDKSKKKKRPALDYSEWSADESYFPPFASDDYDDDYALNYGVADAIATNSSLDDDEESRQEAEDSSSFLSRNDDSIGTFGPIIHGEDRSGDSARVTIDGETDNETTMSSHHSVESGATHNDTVQPKVTTEKTEMMHNTALQGVGNVLQSLPQHSSSPRHDTETTGDTDDDEKTITYSNDNDDDESNDDNNNKFEGMIYNVSEREESSLTQRHVNVESNKPVATGKRSRSDSLWPPRRRRRVFTEKGSGRTSVDESPFQSKISERDCRRKPTINLMSDSEREDNDDEEEETQQDQQSDQEEPKDDNEPADTGSGNMLIDLTNDDEDDDDDNDDDDDDDDEVQIIEPDTNKTVELSTPIVEPSPTAAAARSAARRQYIEYSQPKVPVARAQQHHGDTDDDDDDYEGEIHYQPKGRKMSHNIILDSDDEDDDRKPAAVLVEPSADDFDSTDSESDDNGGVLDEAEAERQRYFAEKRRREVNETFEMITVPPEYHRRHILLLRPAAEKTTTMNDDDTVNSDNLMMNNDDDDDDYDDNETMKKMRKTVKKQKTTKKKGKQAKYGGYGTQCHNRRRINRKPFVKPMHPWRRRPHVPRREAHRFTLTDFNKVMSIAAPK